MAVARCSNSAPTVSALVGCCFVNKERQQTDAYASNRWRFHHPENVRALRHVGRAAKQQTRARTTFDCTHTHSRTALHRAGKTKDSHSHTRTAPSKRRTFRVTALHTHTRTHRTTDGFVYNVMAQGFFVSQRESNTHSSALRIQIFHRVTSHSHSGMGGKTNYAPKKKHTHGSVV